MLSLTTLSESGLHALASWVTDLLVAREKRGYYVKSRVETPIRPLTVEGTQETFPGFPALTAIVGDAYGCDRATAVALLQKIALTFPEQFGWAEEVASVPCYDANTRQPIVDATGTRVTQPQLRHKLWLRSRIRDMVAASDPRARLRAELAQQLPAPPL
jgi:hypothetical protein